MRKLLAQHRQHWREPSFARSALIGLALLGGSLIINYVAATYAVQNASNPVSDFFLDNLPRFDTSFVYVQGASAFAIFTTALLIEHPKRIPFVVKSLALFIFIRAVFFSLTHLGTGSEITSIGDSNNSYFLFSGDLFFSGHTGLPFLMGLIFWENYWLRVIFVVGSILAATCMLLGHYHYSIDVFAAFFITHTIFHLCTKFFEKDYQLFQSGIIPQKAS